MAIAVDTRTIVGVFAHPDDETTTSGGTLAMYAAQGVRVQVITATRGELGTLGQDGTSFTRDELPRVRESELRAVMDLIDARPPVIFDYRDQELERADLGEVSEGILAVLEELRPDVVITWGPMGISGHADHVAVHQAAADAFHRYRRRAEPEPRLYYVAMPRDAAKEFGLDVDGPEAEPTVTVDIGPVTDVKARALRLYRSQQDAQEVAKHVEERGYTVETFHQAHPPHRGEGMDAGFW